jgi:hypothetical protein
MARGVEIYRIAAQACVDQMQKTLVEAAKSVHRRIMQTPPKPSYFTRTVDGVEGLPEERVKPYGIIVYEYSRLDEVVQFALETLFDLSPVLSGEYRSSHLLFVDGVEARNLADYRGGEIVIINTVPYARKIELGRMKMRISDSDQVYAQAVNAVNARFRNQAFVRLRWQSVVTTSRRKSGDATLRYPALVISER